MVGEKFDSVKKQSLLKFDFAYSGIPSNATILNSALQLYYSSAQNAGGSAWVDRWVQAHQVLKTWDELQATRDNRLTATAWVAQYAALDGTDASATMESTMLFQTGQTGTWKIWNLSALTQKWINGTAANYGVILWATNEDVNAYDLRFYSRENATNKPKLVVTWSNTPKTVYFLKDHLGSTRATVDQTGAVVGYDDYDPWGYALSGRTSSTPWSATQSVAENKFTGKERDDEFGINWDYFGARYYDAQIGRWNSPEPLIEKYPSVSSYCYALNNPIILFDLDGKDVFVAFSGGFGGGRELKPNETSTGNLVTALKTYAAESGTTDFNAVGYLSSWSGAAESKLSFDFIKSNLSEGERLIIYGYSNGGDHAVELAETLAKNGIIVDLLLTVDAADGGILGGATVNNTIPDNVIANLNFYQTDTSGSLSGTHIVAGQGANSPTSNSPGSHGKRNKAANPKKTRVTNAKISNTSHSKIGDMGSSLAEKMLRNLFADPVSQLKSHKPQSSQPPKPPQQP